jgi:Uma2 family endonuclease
MTTIQWGRPYVRADLEDTPDDGHRYELIDGVLLVSPSPPLRHQVMLGNLAMLLHETRTQGIAVLPGPLAVALADDTEIQPDVIVALRTQFTDDELVGLPLLVVEVLSPSTRRVDLLLKRDRLQAAGVPSYWLVDPDEPSITILELRDGIYEEVTHAVGQQTCEVDMPFPLAMVPGQLRE